MVELVALVLTLFFIFRTAQRRGGRGIMWATTALVGYMLITYSITMMLGRFPGLYIGAAWAWLGICLAGAWFMTGGLRSAGTTWSCPDCGMYNDPSTLVCACGHQFQPEV